MKYHNNGVLRTEQDSTLWLKPSARNQKLTWVEYLPLVILGILMAFVITSAIVG